MNGGHSVSLFCPECGQALVIPTADLRSTFQCPRCGTPHNTGQLIPRETPIPVAPVVAAAPNAQASQPSLPETTATPPPTAPNLPLQVQRPSMPSVPSVGSQSAWTNHSPAPSAASGAPYNASYHHSGYDRQGVYPEIASLPYTPSTNSLPHALPAASQPSAYTPAPHASSAPPRETTPTPAPNRVSTVEQIGGFGHWFLGVADKADRLLYGRRTTLVALLAVLTIIAGFVDDKSLPVLTAASTWLFTLLLFILVTARIGSLRDDEGGWSPALLGQRISAWLDDMREFTTAGGPLMVQGLGKAVAFLGLLVLGLRNTLMLLLLVANELFSAPLATLDAAESTMSWIGTTSFAVGSLLIVFAWLRIRSTAKTQGLVLDENSKAQLKSSILGLPSLIDCSNTQEIRALIGQSSHPLLKELLEALAAWRPRNANNEQAYHASLYRTLRRRMPGANPEKERPIAADTPELRGRADLVIGDSILIELKARLTKSTAHRAIGQLRMYARAWTQGPIVLVVCGDRNYAHQLLSRELAELHQKAPVFMVLVNG